MNSTTAEELVRLCEVYRLGTSRPDVHGFIGEAMSALEHQEFLSAEALDECTIQFKCGDGAVASAKYDLARTSLRFVCDRLGAVAARYSECKFTPYGGHYNFNWNLSPSKEIAVSLEYTNTTSTQKFKLARRIS